MALMVCPDCENQISDQADQCIHCGRPIARLDVRSERARTEGREEEREDVDPRHRTDVGRNLIDERPKGMDQSGYAITGASLLVGVGLGAVIGGVWGFMAFAVILLVGVFLAYS